MSLGNLSSTRNFNAGLLLVATFCEVCRLHASSWRSSLLKWALRFVPALRRLERVPCLGDSTQVAAALRDIPLVTDTSHIAAFAHPSAPRNVALRTAHPGSALSDLLQYPRVAQLVTCSRQRERCGHPLWLGRTNIKKGNCANHPFQWNRHRIHCGNAHHR